MLTGDYRKYRKIGRKTLFFTFVISFFALRAQERQRLDSLNLLLNGGGPDTSKISALIELSRIYTGINDDRAFYLAQSSVQKSTDAGSAKWLGFALNRLGSLYDVKGKPDSATLCFLKGLKLFEEIGHLQGQAAVYQNIGVMYYYQKDFEKALENYRKALALRRLTRENNYMAQLYNNMGSVMRRRKEYDSAITFYSSALQIKRLLNDKQSLATSLLNISVAYQYKNEFNRAIENVNAAIALCKETGNDYDLSSCYLALGEIYLKLKKPLEAREQALASLRLAEKLGSNELLFNVYEELSLCDTLAGDYKKAYLDFTDAMYYKDQVYTKDKSDAIGRLQTFYDTEKKDNEIRILNADNESRKKQQRFLLVILGLSFVLLVVALWAYFTKQKHNRLLSKQKTEIENKTEQLKEQAAQIARLSSQMNPHFLFNALNSLQKFVLLKDETRTLDHIQQLSALLRATLNNSLKGYITLEEEIQYLDRYLNFEKELLEGLTYSIDAKDLVAEQVVLPPMLIQPLVENAVKHGLANKKGDKRVSVVFEKTDGLLMINVRDNGTGRDPSTKSPGNSKALLLLESRIKAEFEKKGRPATNYLQIHDLKERGGTEVVLHLPLIEEF